MIVEVAEASQVAAARRAAVELSRRYQFEDVREGRVALIATEMATNLVKHAGGGKIVIGCFDDATGAGVELLSLDGGTGISDLSRAMEDGTSSAGSMGGGLGAIRRQSDVFDIFSRPDSGTVIVSRVAASDPSRARTGGAVVGGIVVPYPGETVSGDCWGYAVTGEGPTLMVFDGSGHGVLAEKAASVALTAFHENVNKPCVSLATAIHKALAPTRGGALSVARIDPEARIIRYVGIGNISGTLIADGSMKRMISNNGIAGHVASTIREFAYPYHVSEATIVLHSDGLSGKWDITAYPGLAFSHPSAIAGTLFRDHIRGRDDASIVAVRV